MRADIVFEGVKRRPFLHVNDNGVIEKIERALESEAKENKTRNKAQDKTLINEIKELLQNNNFRQELLNNNSIHNYPEQQNEEDERVQKNARKIASVRTLENYVPNFKNADDATKSYIAIAINFAVGKPLREFESKQQEEKKKFAKARADYEDLGGKVQKFKESLKNNNLTEEERSQITNFITKGESALRDAEERLGFKKEGDDKVKPNSPSKPTGESVNSNKKNCCTIA